MHHLPRARVGDQLQCVRLGNPALVDETALGILYALAGVEADGRRVHLARIGIHLRARQAEWIFRVTLAQLVGGKSQLAAGVGLPRYLGAGLVADGGTVGAIARGFEPRDIAQIVEWPHRVAELQFAAAGTVAAGKESARHCRRLRAVFGKGLNHSAGGVAIDGRERSAQHFDALGGTQVDIRRLTLAVRIGGGNVIDDHANATDAERGACAKSTAGHLQVLRVVLPVRHHDARHAGERLGEIDPRLAVLDIRCDHRVDGHGQIEGGSLRTRASHHDWINGTDVWILGRG